MAPLRSPMALAHLVSLEMARTLVSRVANSSADTSSASLKARCPFIPIPPKHISTPPSSSIFFLHSLDSSDLERISETQGHLVPQESESRLLSP